MLSLHGCKYLANKKKINGVCGITWLNLENIMPSERSQLQKTTYYMMPYI